jgi:two-component system cell cycle sensor histidine kinase PleC
MGADATGVAVRVESVPNRLGLKAVSLTRNVASFVLRRRLLGPALVGLLLLAIIPAAIEAWRTAEGRAIEDGLARIELVAGLLRHEMLKAADAAEIGPTALAAALRSLPRSGRQERVLVADGSGRVVATWPATATLPVRISDVVGEAQPMLVLADRAGAMRVRLEDGTDVLAAVRNLPSGQLAVIQPVSGLDLPFGQSNPHHKALALIALAGLASLGVGCVVHAGRAREAQRTCERMRRRVETALTRGRCGLWDWNVTLGRIHWSESMYDLLGYDRRAGDLCFGEMNALIHPDDGDLRELSERIAADAASHLEHEFRARTASGGWLWLRARAEVSLDAETGHRHLLGIAVDISDERGFVERNALADARLGDAVEAISEAFVLWDADNRLVLCNSKFRKFHELPSEAAVPGASYASIMQAGRPPRIASHVTRENSEEAGSRTLEAQLSDGRWLQINERRTKEGGFVSVGTDITALKNNEMKLLDSERRLLRTVRDLQGSRQTLQRQAQQLAELAERYHEQRAEALSASQAKSEFLAKMSHELRTPLNAVIGFAEVLQREMFGPLGNQRYIDYATHIRASGHELLSIINDILQISRIEAGEVRLATGPVDLEDVVEESLRAAMDPIQEKSILVTRRVDALGFLQADERALQQILSQLIGNAVKFNAAGGSIRVRAARAGGFVNIFVEDTGIGIPQALIPRLGRPFEQAEAAFSRSHGGFGLGLAIARALTEMHGGKLRIRSQEGFGTIVMVHLPVTGPWSGACTVREDEFPAVPLLQAAE